MVKIVTLLLKLNLLHRQLLWRKLRVHLRIAGECLQGVERELAIQTNLYYQIPSCVKYYHYADCLTTSPQSVPKRVFHRVRSSASSSTSVNFSFPYYRPVPAHVLFLIFLFLPSCLLSFPSSTCFRRQFLRKMWPIQLAFLLFDVRRTLLSSLTLCHTSVNNIVHNILARIAVLRLLATIDTCHTTYVCTYNN
jgi:hypothetical protein